MGGYGSTRWKATDTRGRAESCLFVDVRRYHREGWLQPGQVTQLLWTNRGRTSGSASMIARETEVVLLYQCNGEETACTIPVERTPCTYGGDRPWFLCPRCGSRRAVLYAAQPQFWCRECSGLVHGSTRESASDRLAERSNRIRRRLKGEEGILNAFPNRPKGMHRRTYWRLWIEAKQYEAASWGALGVRFGLLPRTEEG